MFKNLLSMCRNIWLKSGCLNSIKIVEVKTIKQCESACVLLKQHCEDLNALGFDCEWVSTAEGPRPVALLQLATAHGLCCLFRLNILGGIPGLLQEILFNSEIIKLGVAPLHDAKFLKRDFGIQVWSTLDLRHLYPKGGGLASLAASEIDVKLNKDWKIICSNWESLELTDSQKDYAAKDAYVAVELFKKWLFVRNHQSFLHGFKQSSYNYLLNEETKSELTRYLDVDYKLKHKPPGNSGCSTDNNGNSKSGKEKTNKSSCVTRKSPLYDNCFMHAPDGQLLCSCDRRKAQWYLDRNLAEVLPGEPYSIKLLFEPESRGTETNEGRYYQQLKQNCCVVCGACESYLKHHVVPKEYRKHFSKTMKDHQSHDIVLMCLNCHHLAVKHNLNLKEKLSILCDAPINVSKVTLVREAQKVKNAAKALLNAGNVIPVKKKIQLEDEVKRYFGVDSLNLNLLEEAANLKAVLNIENSESHGVRVVNYFTKQDGGLKNLEILWRKYFLKTMNPQYLPALWSVTHNHSRLTPEAEKQMQL